jgi:hypothetical protein
MPEGDGQAVGSPAKSRREFFEFVERRLGANQELLETTGKPSFHQLKVFWLEANLKHSPSPLRAEGWRVLEPRFFLREDPVAGGHNHLWLDTSHERIWYVYTFGKRDEVESIIRRDLLGQRGLDQVWLAERFLESVRHRMGYTDRGFRFSFRGALYRDRGEEDMPRFSGKFWLGNEVSPEQHEFLRSAERTFSKSSLRMGRLTQRPDAAGTGVLLEVYARGHMTVTTSEDTDEVLGLINQVGTSYAGELKELEVRRSKFPRPVEYKFGMKVDRERFRAQVESGVGPTKLWMQKYSEEDGLDRYTGVDLHTNELVNLDLAESYGYLVGQRNGCMNAAPRIMTLSAEFLSGKTDMYYEGAPLFA